MVAPYASASEPDQQAYKLPEIEITRTWKKDDPNTFYIQFLDGNQQNNFAPIRRDIALTVPKLRQGIDEGKNPFNLQQELEAEYFPIVVVDFASYIRLRHGCEQGCSGCSGGIVQTCKSIGPKQQAPVAKFS